MARLRHKTLILIMSSFFKKYRFEILLFLFCFVLHLIVGIFFFLKYGSSILYRFNEDATEYLSMAESVALGEGFRSFGVVSAIRTPFYPLFLSLIYLFRLPLFAIVFFQNILFSFAVVFVYRIGREFFSDLTGKIASVLLVLEPNMFFVVNFGTTETVFIFLIVLFTYVFAKWYTSDKFDKKYLILSSVFLALATLTRPVALYLVAVIGFLMIIKWFFRRDKFVVYLKSFIIFVILFLLILSPWLLRQYLVFGKAKLSSIDTWMLYTRITPIAFADKIGVDYFTASEILMSQLPDKIPNFDTITAEHSFEYGAFMTSEAKQLLSEHWPAVARFYSMSLSCGLFSTGYDYMLEDLGLERKGGRISFTETLLKGDVRKFLGAFFKLDIFQLALINGALDWLIIYIFGLIAVIYSLKTKEKFLAMILILILAAYFVFFALGPQCHARYRLPAFPFLLLLGSFGFSIIYYNKRVWYNRIFRRGQ